MKNQNTTIKYILYARKSSESEDRQVASIPDQIEELRKIADANGLKIEKIMSESRSAKAPGRSVFNEMLKQITKGEASGILCWKLNRLARNPIDGGQISWMLQQGTIQHIKTQGQNYYPSDNVIMMAVELGMATQFVRDLAIDTKRGLISKAQKGWLPGRAPVGYLNTKYKDKGTKDIVKDPDRFETVKKIWQYFLEKRCSVKKLHNIVANEFGLRMKNGKPMSLSKMYSLLKNPFYCGYFTYAGTRYEGKQEPMITEEEYERAQAILENRTKPQPHTHHFSYTAMMKCGECGSAITAEEKNKYQKNGNTHHYIYYRCTKKKNSNCTQRYIEEKELNKQIAVILNSISIPQDFYEWALDVLKSSNQQESQSRNTILLNQQRAYDACIKKIDGLIDMRSNNDITQEEFTSKRKELEEEKTRINRLLKQTDERIDHWLEYAEKVFHFAASASAAFTDGDLETKKQTLAALGSNLLLKDRKLILDLNKPLIAIKSGKDIANSIERSLEPPKSIYSIRDFEEIYKQFPVMGAYRDSNPR